MTWTEAVMLIGRVAALSVAFLVVCAGVGAIAGWLIAWWKQ